MGRRLRSLVQEPAIFFVTTSTINNKRLFNDNYHLELVEKILVTSAQNINIRLIAYAIMPSHLHFIAYFPNGGPQLSKFMHTIKGVIRRKIVGNRKIWQDRFDDLQLKSEEQFRIKINYIHNNPVKAGLSMAPEDWPYSSAKAWVTRESDFLVFDPSEF